MFISVAPRKQIAVSGGKNSVLSSFKDTSILWSSATSPDKRGPYATNALYPVQVVSEHLGDRKILVRINHSHSVRPRVCYLEASADVVVITCLFLK